MNRSYTSARGWVAVALLTVMTLWSIAGAQTPGSTRQPTPGQALLMVLKPSPEKLGHTTQVRVRDERIDLVVGRLRGADFLEIELPPGKFWVCAREGSDDPREQCITVELTVGGAVYLEWDVEGPLRPRERFVLAGASWKLGAWGDLTQAEGNEMLRSLDRGIQFEQRR